MSDGSGQHEIMVTNETSSHIIYRAKFAAAWGVKQLPAKPGYCLTEVPHLAKEGKLKAYYNFGEDVVQSDPDAAATREALASMEFVIVQDIFMNKTALHADVILAATSWGEHEGTYTTADRGFQRFRKAIEPKGDVKPDWEIISMMATAMGYPMKYKNTVEIWEELRALCPAFAGVTYERLEQLGTIQWPCPAEDHPGSPYLYKDNRFDTPSGRGRLFAAEWRPPLEQPDSEYPLKGGILFTQVRLDTPAQAAHRRASGHKIWWLPESHGYPTSPDSVYGPGGRPL